MVGAVMIDFFISNGVRVFPIKPGTKAPACESWPNYSGPRPTASYGVALATQLTVVDADEPATLAWCLAQLPPTPLRVQTGPFHSGAPGRGVQFYYRTPAGPMRPAYIHRDTLSIEARRQGQYVLGPGSKHPTGCIYTPTDWSWQWNDLPEFPADFNFDDGTCATSSVDGKYVRPTGDVTAGERTHELFRYLRHLKARDFDEEQTRNYVWWFNQTQCKPPKSEAWFRSWFGRSWRTADRPGFNQLATFEDDGL
jgi:Bifunctional DNA primase/polymerase, N-terminal